MDYLNKYGSKCMNNANANNESYCPNLYNDFDCIHYTLANIILCALLTHHTICTMHRINVHSHACIHVHIHKGLMP